MMANAESLLNMINDILDLSKIESGKIVMEQIDFSLKDTLQTCYPILDVKAKEKSLPLTFHIDPAVPGFMNGDPGRLRQVILNLVGNAIKFTSEGDVRLHISYLKHLNDPTPSHQLKFEIIDSGIGIPEDKVHLLFEEFSQIDASTTRQFGGTGLGLSISKKLTKMMKGEIGVESEFGKGSTFWFTAQFRASGCSLDI
jgi:signal transduction histidine kinase